MSTAINAKEPHETPMISGRLVLDSVSLLSSKEKEYTIQLLYA